MLTTLSVIFLVLSIPFLVQAGRNRTIFSSSPSLIRLTRTRSAPTVPTKKDTGARPKTKRRATEGDGTVTDVVQEGVVEEPDEDEAMLSDTSAESYVRFGRGMTYVDEKVGGGLVRSSVDQPDIPREGPSHRYAPHR